MGSTPQRIRRFPVVKVVGGPTGHGTKVFIDDVQQLGVTHVDIAYDVNDANRATIHHIVDLEIETEALVRHAWRVIGVVNGEPFSYGGKHESVVDALRGLADMFEARAESEQTSPESGTVTGP